MNKSKGRSLNKYEKTQDDINKLLVGTRFQGEFKDETEIDNIADTEKLDYPDIIDDYCIYLFEDIKIVSIEKGNIILHFDYMTMGNTDDEEPEKMEITINDFIKIFIDTGYLDDELNEIKSGKLGKLLKFHKKLYNKNKEDNKEAKKIINKVKKIIDKVIATNISFL